MKTRLFLCLFLLLSVVLLGWQTAVSRAQDSYPPPATPLPDPYIGDVFISPPQQRQRPTGSQIPGLRIAHQFVEVAITDQVAVTHIEQLFVNENDWMLEGTYLFPLPQGAAVSQLTMWVNGQAIEAKILEKEEAREIYDTIVRQLRDPALLEFVGHNLLQANVFPIPPGEERLIEIEYTQLLTAENGLIHYVYPQSTHLYTNMPLDEQRIRVEIESQEPIRAIYSPSHKVAIFRDGENKAVAGYEAAKAPADQDFELYYTVSPETIGLNLLSFREPGEDGFFLLLAAPAVEVDEVVAKDVIMVLDISGSMDGEKLSQAQTAANYVAAHLNPDDRFNIVAFSSGVRTLAPDLLPAQDAETAVAFINRLEAAGGTNISAALLEAAHMVAAERPTTIIFLTDGLATEGITETPLLLDAVTQALPDSARIFVFGVGNDVDPSLLDNLAQNQRGVSTYVRPGQSIDEIVSGFYAKVSTPVLSDITLDIDGVVVEQMYPQTLPDLFAGAQLVLAGRYRQGGTADITLSGEVNGRSQTFVYPDQTFQDAGGAAFIPRLWATRAVGQMLQDINLHGPDEELQQSIITLSKRYGIITPYTSFLIEEDDILAQQRDGTIAETVVEEGQQVEVTRVVVEEVIVQEAVEMAADASEMKNMAAPLPVPRQLPGTDAAVAELSVQTVGDKTFVYTQGVWADTAYDPDVHALQEVVFAGDDYFDLLVERPYLGQYFALGQAVLVVVDGQAFQVTASDMADSEPLTGVGQETIDGVSEVDATAVPQPNMCGALLAMPLLLGFGAVVTWYGRRDW